MDIENGNLMPTVGERRWWYSLGLQQTIACLASSYEEAWKTMQHHREKLHCGAVQMGRANVSGAANQPPVPLWAPIVATPDFVEWAEVEMWATVALGPNSLVATKVPGGWRVGALGNETFVSVPMANNVHFVEVPSGLTLGVIELPPGMGQA